MATLNGAEFKIIEAEWSTYQNNVIQEILGSDTVEVQNQGHGSDPVRIQGMVNNEKEMDDFQEQFYSNGVLTFIKDPGSDRQYQVYALGNVRRENITNSLLDQGIIFTCMMQLRYPYSESVDTITRSKSITTQNQEWNTDDNSIDIKTIGNVNAVPEIRVTGGISDTSILTLVSPNPVGEPSFETVTGWTESENDSGGYVDGGQDPVVGGFGDGSYAWEFTHNVNTPIGDWTQVARNVDFTGIDYFKIDFHFYSDLTSSKEFRVYADSTLLYSLAADGGQHDDELVDCRSVLGTKSLKIQFYSTSVLALGTADNQVDNIRSYKLTPIKNIEIYNTADSTVKCFVANDVLEDAIHAINPDGTGTIDYDDDFSTTKWTRSSTFLNITHDETNDELDIADDGYIYWKIDTKLPINGIPTLTSRVNITSGIPTIQISTDASTWYDIDTAIVDDVETEYPLDSEGNLSLPGKTLFYFRYDCVKAAAATCSIKNFELDVDIHTIYAKNPKISKGATASTFRCDQDSESGMVCTVDLIFKNRWWV